MTSIFTFLIGPLWGPPSPHQADPRYENDCPRPHHDRGCPKDILDAHVVQVPNGPCGTHGSYPLGTLVMSMNPKGVHADEDIQWPWVVHG